jgi:hypothetical protein
MGGGDGKSQKVGRGGHGHVTKRKPADDAGDGDGDAPLFKWAKGEGAPSLCLACAELRKHGRYVGSSLDPKLWTKIRLKHNKHTEPCDPQVLATMDSHRAGSHGGRGAKPQANEVRKIALLVVAHL